MGQALKKFGSDERKEKEIGPVLEGCYEKYFANTEDWSLADFYHAVCLTVEYFNFQFDINKKLGSTQFRVPKKSTLEQAYKKHHQGKGKALTKEEFQKIFQDVVIHAGVTSIGAKDTLMYIFGVPMTALFFKQCLIPTAIPNEIFIPGVTSAAVFLLAKLNKI